MSETALQAVLEEGLGEIHVAPPLGAVATLASLCCLVEAWGRRMNLSAHQDSEAVARRLVLDAVALLARLPSFQSLADLGSGAGFPGLPIAVLRPDTRVFLVEARERRHHFQREVVRQLRLENVQAVRGRFEAVAPSRCELVVAQAVAPPDELVPQMLRWASRGATLAVPGGAESRSAGRQTGLESSEVTRYRVPLSGLERTLWLGRAL